MDFRRVVGLDGFAVQPKIIGPCLKGLVIERRQGLSGTSSLSA
jgi:hypothetical protein